MRLCIQARTALDLQPGSGVRKKGHTIAAALEHAQRCPHAVVALFQDEASFYRQPSQASLWAWAGRQQPRLPWSHRKNHLVRLAACLNAQTGATHYRQAPKINVAQLLHSYREILSTYPDALMIYLIQDNWPVHFHPAVKQFLAEHPRLTVLPLPTYAPRLNPIEKVWRWIRQTLCHAHPYCDDFRRFKAQLQNACAEAQTKPDYLRHYCGLDREYIFS